MEAKALNYLSLARKAGLAELGEEPVGDASRAGKAYVIAVAGDASEHTWRRAKAYAAGTEQQCVRLPFSKEELLNLVLSSSHLITYALTVPFSMNFPNAPPFSVSAGHLLSQM